MKTAPISLFAQLMSFVSREEFSELESKQSEKKTSNARKYSRWDQFIALIFCHLAGSDSLREIEDGLYGADGKMNHLGACALKRTTLAYQNKTYDYRLFKDLYFRLLKKFESAFGQRLSKRFQAPVYSLDSTTISLCMKLFSWAQYRTRKGGMKLHTIISNDTLLPVVMDMTHAKKADIKMAKSTIEQLPEFSFVVMDRGYNDYGLFEWMTLRGTHFVTRLKETAKTTLPAKKTRDKGETWGDYEIQFQQDIAEKGDAALTYRLVQWFDKEHNRWFEFLTNDFELTPNEVSELYRERWQVELFFKKLKQNLKIKSFIGTSENAVMCQIWTAAICTLLVELISRRAKFSWSFSRLMAFLRLNLMTHKDLNEWIDRPALPLRRLKRRGHIPSSDGEQLTLFG